MTGPQANTGLCSNCAHAIGCSVTGRKGNRVFQCSEYEAGQLIALENGRRTDPDDHRREDRLLGLCVDCGHQEECTFPRPEGGIWHCEEYAAE